jgi:hypothetical protein
MILVSKNNRKKLIFFRGIYGAFRGLKVVSTDACGIRFQ